MTANDATRDRGVVIHTMGDAKLPGVAAIKLRDYESLMKKVAKVSFLKLNVLWAVADLISPSNKFRPNWSGFMQTVVSGAHSGVSDVEMLSTVDLNPSDTDCIYSTLVYVIDQAKAMRISTPDITFDQPLYIKAFDVALKGNLDIVVRLGGFHMLMSFLGSIGHLMRGSGMEEVMGVLFGPNTIEHILNGKAYARAVRGHLLIYKALSELLLDYLKSVKSPDEDVQCDEISPAVHLLNDDHLIGSMAPSTVSSLNELYTEILNNGFHYDDDDNVVVHSELIRASLLFDELKSALSSQSRTARLWLYYMKCVDLLKLFLCAERTGDWLLHLHVVHEMLPVFAATGHMNYAKSARVYLQQMHDLETSHPLMDSKFVDGNHTVRRSDRFWAGLSMDLVIEQTMMRAIKSRGGLTRGRGFHESVRITWLSTLTQCSSIRAALSQFVGLETTSCEHPETGASRAQRDYQDCKKVKAFLEVYSPFKFVDEFRLVSLCSGVVAGPEDEVNCEQAECIGKTLQRKWDGMSFADLSLKKADQIKNMTYLSNTCSIESDKVNIDPNTLFHRLIIAGERFGTLKNCFHFELSPYPMSLFKSGLMRKPDKPSLYRDCAKGMTDAAKPSRLLYVVDGGYLLHKVRWAATMNVSDVLTLFLKYVNSLGEFVVVVFDGYDSGPSIKDQEHSRRSLKGGPVVPDRQIKRETQNIGNQEAFLSNVTNKKSLITLLSVFLQEHGVNVHQATGDADTLIVSVALKVASSFISLEPVAVVAEDTDILVLLLYHRQQDMKDIFFISDSKRGRGGKTITGKCINITQLQNKLGPKTCSLLLVAHALGGCDTTSSIFGLGKGTILKKISDNPALYHDCCILQLDTSSVDDVCSVGIHLMAALYGAKEGESLANLRYTAYCNSSLSHRFMAERLPPSEDAAQLHAKRVHLQAVIWSTLGNTNLNPTSWGWKLVGDQLKPIALEGPVAPEHILNVVRCKCKGKCSSTSCSCKKHGLHCVTACNNCHGTDCSNVQTVLLDDCGDSERETLASEIFNDDCGQGFFDDEFNLNVHLEEEV